MDGYNILLSILLIILSNNDKSLIFADYMYAFSGTVNGNTMAGICILIPLDIPL